MSKVLSIEVGAYLTRICEMDYKAKAPKVYKSVTISTPDNALEDGFINESPEFVKAIKETLLGNKIRTKQVIFTVTSTKIATREAVLPALKDNQIDSMIRTNVTDYLPIDPNMYEIAHMTLGDVMDEDGSARRRVLIMAADKQLVDSYEAFAEKCGLKIIGLDYSGNSVFQIMRNECKEDCELVIKIEEKNTICTIINEKNLMMQRNMAYGVDSVIEAVQESDAFDAKSYEDALDLLRGKTLLRNVLSEKTRVIETDDGADDSDKIAAARDEITQSLAILVGNISRVLDLYNNKNTDRQVKHACIIGIGADISGLSKLFTNELGVKTSAVKTITGMNFMKVPGEKGSGRYITAAGASIAPVGFVNSEKSKANMMEVNYRNTSILLGILFVLIAGVMVWFSVTPYLAQMAQNIYLKQQEAIYAPAEDVYNSYVATGELYTQVYTAYSSLKTPNDNLLAFLEELEETMPYDAELIEFTSNAEQAVITLSVDDLEKAARLIQKMRDFDNLMDVSVADITIEELEEDEAEARRIRIARNYAAMNGLEYTEETAEEIDEAIAAETAEETAADATDVSVALVEEPATEEPAVEEVTEEVTETEEVPAEIRVTFSLVLTYKPVGAETDEEVTE